jgi:AraC family transcriptional regulator
LTRAHPHLLLDVMKSNNREILFVGSAVASRVAGDFSLGHWITHGFGDNVRGHGHAQAHFMYVPESCGYITEARGERSRGQAHLIFNPVQTYHRDRLTAPGRFFSITLSTALTATTAELQLPGAPSQIGNGEAHIIVAKLMRICERWKEHAPLRAEALCLELVAASLTPGTAERDPPRWLKEATNYLHDNFVDEISIGEIGRQVGVHPVHLARVFRRFLGCTPGDFLRNIRIERASKLLGRSRLSSAEIALATGFADQSHFTKQFRRAFGLPPGEYRRLTAGSERNVAIVQDGTAARP